MEEDKLVALHEELSRHGPGRGGLSSRNDFRIPKDMRKVAARNAAADAADEYIGDDLKTRRKRALYRNFVREGERHKKFAQTQRTRMVFHDEDEDEGMCPGRCGRCKVCLGAAKCNEQTLASSNRSKKKSMKKVDVAKARKEERRLSKKAKKERRKAGMTKAQKAAAKAGKLAAKKAAKLAAKKAAKLAAKIAAKKAEKERQQSGGKRKATIDVCVEPTKKMKVLKKLKKAKKDIKISEETKKAKKPKKFKKSKKAKKSKA